MGTRGLMAFAHNGEVKAMYNHFDSYPTGLGETMVNWMLEQHGDFTEAIEQFERLQPVNEEDSPTEDQKLALVRYLDLRVGNQTDDDWYNLLRETQGNPTEALKAGFFVEYFKFGKDSLFCEFAYVADLDKQVLEVYKGFVNEPHDKGRWADGLKAEPTHRIEWDEHTPYYPIQLVRTYSLAELAEPEVMEVLDKELDEDDD